MLVFENNINGVETSKLGGTTLLAAAPHTPPPPPAASSPSPASPLPSLPLLTPSEPADPTATAAPGSPSCAFGSGAETTSPPPASRPPPAAPFPSLFSPRLQIPPPPQPLPLPDAPPPPPTHNPPPRRRRPPPPPLHSISLVLQTSSSCAHLCRAQTQALTAMPLAGRLLRQQRRHGARASLQLQCRHRRPTTARPCSFRRCGWLAGPDLGPCGSLPGKRPRLRPAPATGRCPSRGALRSPKLARRDSIPRVALPQARRPRSLPSRSPSARRNTRGDVLKLVIGLGMTSLKPQMRSGRRPPPQPPTSTESAGASSGLGRRRGLREAGHTPSSSEVTTTLQPVVGGIGAPGLAGHVRGSSTSSLSEAKTVMSGPARVLATVRRIGRSIRG